MSSDHHAPLVAQTIERFLADRGSAEDWERTAASTEGWSHENWRRMAELGWLGICLPESVGGLGCSLDERMALMEAVGRGLLLEPYLGTAVLCAELLQAAGSEAQQAGLLPAVATGELVLAFACAEPASGHTWQDTTCTATPEGDGWRLQGCKIAVLDAPHAHRLIVLARTSGAPGDAAGLSLFLVDPRQTGVSLRVYPTVDQRRCADIAFENVRLGGSALLGHAGQAHDAVDLALDHARVAACAEAVGVMTELVATTVAYLRQRRQFGRPLSQFQVLRHRVADMHVACEQARALSACAAGTLAATHPRRSANAAAACVQVGWSARFVGQQAVHLHGGMGVSNELRVGHFFKRLMAIEAMFGTADHHLRRFGEIAASP